ncbi:MAG: diacylglycerol kinase family lipid kinase [Paludibacter sp.]|jgi:diacylglycerol kinase (ATP)|nr:diacylglycerol kinase family lipid kinase [Paludibacter sp.]
MEITSQHWGIIINPKSGKKKFRRQRRHLFQILKKRGIPFDYRITQFAGHAIDIARYFVENQYKNILVLGGDGTTSEVVNGIFSSSIENTADITLAIIPRGTGNDWGRFWGLTRKFKKSVEVFLAQQTQAIDIGSVEYSVEDKRRTHFFINSIGFGLDAAVVNLTHKLKETFGSNAFLYTVSLLLSVFSYKYHRAKVSSGDNKFSGSMFTMNIANGCYSGGGLKQNPFALPYDGLLDLMFMRRPKFSEIISGLAYLFCGRMYEHQIVKAFRADEILVQCDKKTLVEADGIIVNGFSPYKIKLLPNAIKMVIP